MSESDLTPAGALNRFYVEQARYYSGGEIEPLGKRLTEDVAWHVPGQNAIAGTHRGKPAVQRYFAKRRELSNGSFRVRPGKILSSGELLVQFADGEVQIGGELFSWETVGVFRVRGSRVAECWLIPVDQAQFDRLWS